jgi:cytidylate kinase
MRHDPIIAIDGPAGSGKSTVAQQAARAAGLQFISSGSLYRAVALLARRAGVDAHDHDQLTRIADRLNIRFTTDADGMVRGWLGGEDVTDALRDPATGELASTIATQPAVRAHLVRALQEYGRHGGIVMEGRDIQTVVFPDAEIKVFLTASDTERARRRWHELRARGEEIAFQTVLHEVKARDARDSGRAAAPLRAAEDAVCLDTDGRTVAQVVDDLLRLLSAWRARPELRGTALAHAAGLC